MGSPLRHLVIGKLNAPKHPTHELEEVEPGFSVNYAGFDVYLMSVDTWTAVFDVVENAES